MKRHIAIAATLLLAAGSALAGPHGGPAGGAPNMDRLAILLDLDEGQKVAVKQVLDEQQQLRAQQWQQAKESQTRPSREEMRTRHEQMRKDTIEKLRPILSDQQLTKYEALAAQPRGHKPHKQRKSE